MNLKLSKETIKELTKQAEFGLSLLDENIDFIGRIMDDNIVEYLTEDQDLLMYICKNDEREKLVLCIHPDKGVARIPLTRLLETDLDASQIADMYEHDVDMIERNRVVLLKLFSELTSAIDKAHKKAKTIAKKGRK